MFPKISLTALALMTATILPTLAKAGTSYPMTCRGGAGSFGYDGGRAKAFLYFQKASGPAGAGLAPGQCAWADRAVNAAEPSCLVQNGVAATAWLFPGNLGNSYYSSTQAPWLRSLASASAYQVFQATNTGDGGCFLVTRLGP